MVDLLFPSLFSGGPWQIHQSRGIPTIRDKQHLALDLAEEKTYLHQSEPTMLWEQQIHGSSMLHMQFLPRKLCDFRAKMSVTIPHMEHFGLTSTEFALVPIIAACFAIFQWTQLHPAVDYFSRQCIDLERDQSTLGCHPMAMGYPVSHGQQWGKSWSTKGLNPITWCWLVGQGHPSEKYEFVNWDD